MSKCSVCGMDRLICGGETIEHKEKDFVSICIPLWEKDEWFDKLIDSIKSHDAGMPYEICVGEGHNAASVNRNKAMRQAKSNYILQLDGDAAIIQDNWLKNMFDALKSDEKIGVVGCILEFPTGIVDHCGTVVISDEDAINARVDLLMKALEEYYKEFMKNHITRLNVMVKYEANKDKIEGKIYQVHQCSGACFLFDRRRMGEFLECYQKAGWEDADFMERVISIGYDIVIDGRVRVQHPNHIRSEEEQKWRDDRESKRGFNYLNFHKYITSWGVM